MTPTAILALVLLAMVVGAIVGALFGWDAGIERGRDLQRVADILDQWKGGWRKLPPRGNGGRFTKECGQ